MNARRTHALSFLLNGDLQLMSSGRQTGHRLGGWDDRPEEGATSPLGPFCSPCWLPAPVKTSGPKPNTGVLQDRLGLAVGSRRGILIQGELVPCDARMSLEQSEAGAEVKDSGYKISSALL